MSNTESPNNKKTLGDYLDEIREFDRVMHQSELQQMEDKIKYMEKEAANLNVYNKNMKKMLPLLEEKEALQSQYIRTHIRSFLGLNRLYINDNSEKKLNPKIKLALEIIGIIASILGIIAFYLDYIR